MKYNIYFDTWPSIEKININTECEKMRALALRELTENYLTDEQAERWRNILKRLNRLEQRRKNSKENQGALYPRPPL